MNKVEVVEVDNYLQFLTKVNSIFDVNCLDIIPKNLNSYTIKMFDRRKDLIDEINNKYAQSLNSYIILSGSLKDSSKDLVVLFLDNIYTDLSHIVIGGHYE